MGESVMGVCNSLLGKGASGFLAEYKLEHPDCDEGPCAKAAIDAAISCSGDTHHGYPEEMKGFRFFKSCGVDPPQIQYSIDFCNQKRFFHSYTVEVTEGGTVLSTKTRF